PHSASRSWTANIRMSRAPHIRSDNGPEFVANAVHEWIAVVGASGAVQPKSNIPPGPLSGGLSAEQRYFYLIGATLRGILGQERYQAVGENPSVLPRGGRRLAESLPSWRVASCWPHVLQRCRAWISSSPLRSPRRWPLSPNRRGQRRKHHWVRAVARRASSRSSPAANSRLRLL